MTSWKPDLKGRHGPKYQAIVAAIAADLESGRLRPGDRLPTHRDLADRLRVTVGTVSRAYAEADRRGLVRGEVGRGTFVRPSGAAADPFPSPDPNLPGFIDLSMNLPVVPAAAGDATALEKTLAELPSDADLPALLGYQPPGGTEHHRTAGARWIARSGLDARPEEVLVCSGAQHAMLVTLATLLQPGDLVYTEEVTYPGMKALAGLLRLRVEGVAVDSGGLRPDAFEAACRSRPARALYCIPTLQNPTTSIMPEPRRREIAAIARTHDVAIVEDDCYGFLLDEAPVPISFFAPERGYYLASLAKTVAPGLRVGFLRAPAEAVESLQAAIRATTWMTAPLMAEIARTWIEAGTAERLLLRTREETAARQELAVEILAGQDVETHPRSCHVWLHLPEPWRSQAFVEAARARGVGVTAAEAFVVGRAEAPHSVRICLGAARSREELERGLRILVRVAERAQAAYTPVL